MAYIINPQDVLLNRVAIKTLNNCLENSLSAVELLKIKEYKDQIYSKYLNLTKVNYLIYYLILELHKTNRIILLTNTNKNRADELVKFYDLQNYFSYIYYNSSRNKYYNLINNLNLDPNNLIVYDDETIEI